MATFSKQKLSASTDGKCVKVVQTATPGTDVHTAQAGTSGWDQVYLWVTNVDSQARLLTLEWGGVVDPDDLIVKQLSIPPNSPPIPVLTGQVLQNGRVLKAFGSVANVLILSGYVDRIS